ncbi:MAG: DEAD/DEAH box helicase, partial [Bacteroidetes bacterium]|nr:DEAD/DEAH box helicase [Bacteroidota bacterium]
MSYASILAKFKIEQLNPMQVETIAAIEQKDDVMLISPTGSGKTLAFLLPLLSLLKPVPGIQVLIMVPTRELAIQIEQVFKQITTEYKINCCYGGHPVR